MAGTAQQALHPARPVFLLDLNQRLQLAQVVRIARRVQYALQSPERNWLFSSICDDRLREIGPVSS